MANITIQTSADPAANNEIAALTVPASTTWVVLSATVDMVQGATDTPWPSLVFDDGTNVLFRGLAGSAAQAVSTTRRHSWARGTPLTGGASDAAATGPLAPVPLLTGYRVRTLTGGLGANSNYGVMRLLVAELTFGDRIEDWI